MSYILPVLITVNCTSWKLTFSSSKVSPVNPCSHLFLRFSNMTIIIAFPRRLCLYSPFIYTSIKKTICWNSMVFTEGGRHMVQHRQIARFTVMCIALHCTCVCFVCLCLCNECITCPSHYWQIYVLMERSFCDYAAVRDVARSVIAGIRVALFVLAYLLYENTNQTGRHGFYSSALAVNFLWHTVSALNLICVKLWGAHYCGPD